MMAIIAMMGFVIPSALGEHEFITAPFSIPTDEWLAQSKVNEYGEEVYRIFSPDYSTVINFYPEQTKGSAIGGGGDVREFVDDKWTLDLMKEKQRNICYVQEECQTLHEQDRIYEIDGYRALTIFYTYTNTGSGGAFPVIASITNIYGENYHLLSILSLSKMKDYAEDADSIEKIIQSFKSKAWDHYQIKKLEAAAKAEAAAESNLNRAAVKNSESTRPSTSKLYGNTEYISKSEPIREYPIKSSSGNLPGKSIDVSSYPPNTPKLSELVKQRSDTKSAVEELKEKNAKISFSVNANSEYSEYKAKWKNYPNNSLD